MGTEAEPAKPNGTPAVAPKTVPQERFNTVVAEKRELATRVASLEAEAQALTERAGTADTLAKRVEEMTKEHAAKAAAWGEERALLGAGITDPEDADVARLLYSRLPADGKPKTIADYVAGLKAEGAVVPKALAHLFAAAEPPKTEQAKTTTAKPPPKTPANTGKTAGTAESVSVEALRDLRQKAQSSGDAADWAAWKEAADAAMKARGT